MGWSRYGLILCAAAACLSGCASSRVLNGTDLGFVASSDETMEGHRRVRALGPLVEYQAAPDGRRFLAVRPFFSRVTDPEPDRAVLDVLWPVASGREAFGETTWRVLLAFGNDRDSDAPDSRYRFVIPPVFFLGRDAEGEGYVALFPLGGSIHELLLRDRMTFALWPLYCRTEIDAVTTQHLLWPIVAWGGGPGMRKFRVFPLYGVHDNVDRWTKRFVLWPIWNSVQYHYPGETGGGFILFPVVGHIETDHQETWMLIPPFFKWSSNDEGYREIFAPWPFVQIESGEDLSKTYLWPLWGRKDLGAFESGFLLWPIVHWDSLDNELEHRRRLMVVPFVFSSSRAVKTAAGTESDEARDPAEAQAPPEASASPAAAESPQAPGAAVSEDVVSKSFKLWPLWSYRRRDDVSRFRTLALWPAADMAPVERNWAPLWTLYSREQQGEAVEHECLWGLVRSRRDGKGSGRFSLFPLVQTERTGDGQDYRRWSLLMGLLGYEREGLRSQVRLLYFLTFGDLDQESSESEMEETHDHP